MPPPVTTIVYSHFHVDHVGDGKFSVDEAQKAGNKLRIVASKETADTVAFMKSRLPQPTLVLARLKDSFKCVNLPGGQLRSRRRPRARALHGSLRRRSP
jgi:glyoxylase-like metal-dependent hydrolase (beta-lactamase superfamily II)